jgi:hypothetical protein
MRVSICPSVKDVSSVAVKYTMKILREKESFTTIPSLLSFIDAENSHIRCGVTIPKSSSARSSVNLKQHTRHSL